MRLFFAVALAGCVSPPPKCITIDTTCSPEYVPNFHNIYTNTLQSSCGATNSSCHSDQNRAGGMSFADELTAYDALLAPKSIIDPSRPRVDPGDPACSLLVVRTDSPGASYQMPPLPAAPIMPGERCAIIQWIAAGAGSGM
jgi:hypothetical protein